MLVVSAPGPGSPQHAVESENGALLSTLVGIGEPPTFGLPVLILFGAKLKRRNPKRSHLRFRRRRNIRIVRGDRNVAGALVGTNLARTSIHAIGQFQMRIYIGRNLIAGIAIEIVAVLRQAETGEFSRNDWSASPPFEITPEILPGR